MGNEKKNPLKITNGGLNYLVYKYILKFIFTNIYNFITQSRTKFLTSKKNQNYVTVSTYAVDYGLSVNKVLFCSVLFCLFI